MMTAVLRLIAGIAAGATAMYLLDPVSGRRRRTVTRDQGAAACRKATRLAAGKSRQMADRTKGALAKARGRIIPGEVDDATLAERVRAVMGHVIVRPSAVEVSVDDGRVVLQGRVREAEKDSLVRHVGAIPGVTEVSSRLEPFDDPDADEPPKAP